MTSLKKNQHYIPKFYLRYFSINNNQKQISLFNTLSGKFVSEAKIKTQGSKNFFYDNDGTIEEKLANIENKLAPIILNLLKTHTLPKVNSNLHIDLLVFVALTFLRNPVQIKLIELQESEMKKRIKQLHPDSDTSEAVHAFEHKERITLSLSSIDNLIKNMLDLNFKIIENKSATAFITSDFPIIRYNQFLESLNYPHGKSGYGNTGLQIFIPLDSSSILHFYDKNIYKVGNRKDSKIILTKKEEVDQLNILQVLNCFQNVYFNQEISENYIKRIFEMSKKYRKANEIKSNVGKVISDKGIEDGNMIVIGVSDCEIGLKLSGIKRNSLSKGLKLHPSMAQLRKGPSTLRQNN